MDGEPTKAELVREFRGWHIWQGVNRRWYARRLRTSPPVVVRADSAAELRDNLRGGNEMDAAS